MAYGVMEKRMAGTRDQDGWGSCQYASAKDMFNMYVVRRAYRTSDDVLLGFGVYFTHDGVIPFSTIKAMEIAETIKMNTNEDGSMDDEGEEDVKRLMEVQNFDDLLRAYRESSADLWSMINMLGVFRNVEMRHVPSIDAVDIDNDNVMVGLLAALLMDYGIVEREESFTGFDT